ncbi:hypothetical protein DITRI_Ditri10aG0092600 [Diplodiscus trichospermus]
MSHTSHQSVVQPGLPLMRFGPGDVGLPWSQDNEVPPEDRTMFVTFSKGIPIESLHMQEVRPDKQSLFARIFCHSASAIEVILDGRGKAKFTVNGNHVWARKFVPKPLKPSLVAPSMNMLV